MAYLEVLQTRALSGPKGPPFLGNSLGSYAPEIFEFKGCFLVHFEAG